MILDINCKYNLATLKNKLSFWTFIYNFTEKIELSPRSLSRLIKSQIAKSILFSAIIIRQCSEYTQYQVSKCNEMKLPNYDGSSFVPEVNPYWEYNLKCIKFLTVDDNELFPIPGQIVTCNYEAEQETSVLLKDMLHQIIHCNTWGLIYHDRKLSFGIASTRESQKCLYVIDISEWCQAITYAISLLHENGRPY